MEEEELTLQKVTIGGSALASLLHRSSAAPGDTDGLLFGRVSMIAPSTLSDDNHSAKSAAFVATITGFLAAGATTSFYDSAGNLDLVSLRQFLHLSPSHHLLGWFSARRRSPPCPSIREFSVSRSLSSDSEFAFSVENSSSSFFFPSILLLLTTPSRNPQTLIHTHDYRAYQFSTSTAAFEAKPVDIVNIGPAFRGHYSNFSPNSELPYLSCNLKGSSMNGTDSLTYMKKLLADQRQLDMYVQGSKVLDLNKLLGSGSANYTSGLENLYEKSLAKLDNLAKLVQSSSAKVLEQENFNARLRVEVAALE